MIERLGAAWQEFLVRYVHTGIQPAGGPASAVIWGEADVQLLVAHFLMSSPGGELTVHQQVAGFKNFGPISLVVTDPAPWLASERAPWARFTRASAVDLAVEIKVVNNRDHHAAVEKSARKLEAILKGRLAREVALCVLDKTIPPDRGFFEALEDTRGVLMLVAFDEDLAAPPG
ncbi:MAG TPA: hypothetical protein VFY93_12695 [Planctomycetota bacterium]|nr:hypothetical protein [Planctomycetota bacterium]